MKFGPSPSWADNINATTLRQKRVPKNVVYNSIQVKTSVKWGIHYYFYASRIVVRLLAEVKHFSLLQNVKTDPEAHPTPYSMDTGVLSGGKVAGK